MKIRSGKVKFSYFIRKSLYLFATALLWAGCEKEAPLSDKSVVETGAVKREKTALDQWISETFTHPYGIEVEYRWDKNVVPDGNYAYPPEASKVKSVLETIKTLWIDLYTAPEIGGDKFLLGKNPLKIYMYGGRGVDGNGMELMDNPEITTLEMSLYNVNEFDPKDADKVFVLMRSVHHQFARHLMELLPYDRNKFMSISKNKYIESSESIAGIFRGETKGRRVFALFGYANKRGFFTLHSILSPEKEFAEIISSKLTHTPKEILKALTEAKTPYTASDQELQNEYNEQARQAYKELVEKQALVEDYFNKEVKISLNYLQLISIKQLKAFTKQQ